MKEITKEYKRIHRFYKYLAFAFLLWYSKLSFPGRRQDVLLKNSDKIEQKMPWVAFTDNDFIRKKSLLLAIKSVRKGLR